MSLKFRRLLYIAASLLFIIIAPTLVYYAAGYRYNWYKGKVQQTGVLIIESVPEDAQIFLNEELQKQLTPARITNLAPGDYGIKVTKDGFTSWNKQLPVAAGIVTFVQNMVLLSDKTSPRFLTASSPNKQNINKKNTILAGKEGTYYFDTIGNYNFLMLANGGDTREIYKTPKTKKFSLSAIGAYVTLMDTENQEMIILRNTQEIFNASAKGFEWSESGKKLLYWNDFELKIFYPDNRSEEIVTRSSKKITEAIWYPNLEYVIYILDNALNIIELDQRDARNAYQLFSMDKMENISINKKGDLLNFYGEKEGQKGLWQVKIQ